MFLMPLLQYGQWVDVSTGKFKYAGICSTISEDTVVIAGVRGYIYHTYDGGLTFDSVQTIFNFGEWFNEMQFTSDGKGFICGGTAFGHHTNFLASTHSAGQSWDSLTSNQFSGHSFTNIHFINNQIGFVSGEGSTFLKTTDGGQTLTPITLPFTGRVQDVFFSSLQTGYLALYTSDLNGETTYRILKTVNQGINFSEVYKDTVQNNTFFKSRRVATLHFIDDQLGYAGGDNGLFLKTVDGGASWSQSQLLTDTTFFTQLHFLNKDTGYAVGRYAYGGKARNTLLTTDGGVTWFPVPYQFDNISFANEQTGYGIANGKLYKTTQAGHIGIEELKLSAVHVFPNPANGFVHLKADENLLIKEITLFNTTGQLVRSFDAAERKLNLEGLPTGQYILDIKSANGAFRKKVMML